MYARFLVSAPLGGPGATHGMRACESPLSFSGTGRSVWTASVIAEVADHHRLRLDMLRRAGAAKNFCECFAAAWTAASRCRRS